MKRAYKLGFEVGYYGHYESLGWIRRENAGIRKMAQDLGITLDVSTAYEKGKRRGSEQRRSKLSGGPPGRIEPHEEENLFEYRGRRRRPSPVHVRPLVLDSPGVMNQGEILDLPKILRERGGY